LDGDLLGTYSKCEASAPEAEPFNPKLPGPFDTETAGVSDDPTAGTPLPTPTLN